MGLPRHLQVAQSVEHAVHPHSNHQSCCLVCSDHGRGTSTRCIGHYIGFGTQAWHIWLLSVALVAGRCVPGTVDIHGKLSTILIAKKHIFWCVTYYFSC
jgi:hypothetical protein